MKMALKDEEWLNLDLFDKKTILQIKIINEDSNYWQEFKTQIMFYKVIIGENIIWTMIMKIYMITLYKY